LPAATKTNSLMENERRCLSVPAPEFHDQGSVWFAAVRV